jgi:hypothetical protein
MYSAVAHRRPPYVTHRRGGDHQFHRKHQPSLLESRGTAPRQHGHDSEVAFDYCLSADIKRRPDRLVAASILLMDSRRKNEITPRTTLPHHATSQIVKTKYQRMPRTGGKNARFVAQQSRRSGVLMEHKTSIRHRPPCLLLLSGGRRRIPAQPGPFNSDSPFPSCPSLVMPPLPQRRSVPVMALIFNRTVSIFKQGETDGSAISGTGGSN